MSKNNLQGWFFSPSQRSFFRGDVHGSNMPDDVVKVSDETYAEVFKRHRAEGLPIVPGKKGQPVIGEPRPPSEEQQKLNAQQGLLETDRVAMRCFKSGVPFPPEWRSYTEALRVVARDGGELPGAPATYPEGS